MDVVFGTYKGFQANDFTPIHAPNPKCCSNARYLCPTCAAKALSAAGITANSSQSERPTRPEPLGQPRWDFDSPEQRPATPQPVVNAGAFDWQSAFEADSARGRGKPEAQPAANARPNDRPTPMGQPSWDWDAIARQGD